MALDNRLERFDLLCWVADAGYGPERMFGNEWTLHRGGQAQYALLYFRREPDEHQHLRDPGAGEALPAGDVGLVGDRAGVEFLPPSEGLAERLDHGRRPGLARRLRRFGRVPGRGYGGNHAVGGHLARQDADIAVLERALRSERDFDRLFAEFDRSLDVVGGYMDNTEPDLGEGPAELTEGSPGSFIPSISSG